MSGYYVPRWKMFVQYLQEADVGKYNVTELNGRFLGFEENWQTGNASVVQALAAVGGLQDVLGQAVGTCGGVLGIA